MTKTKKILFLALALMLYAAPGVFASTNLNVPRSGHTTTVLPNGNILITGGHEGDGVPIKKAEIYISSKASYENLPDMDTARKEHTATLLPDGRVFIFGGNNSTASGSAVRTYTIFNPATNSFSNSTTLTSVSYRAGHSATLITSGKYKNMVMLCGGYDFPEASSTCDIVKFDNNGTPSRYPVDIHMIGDEGKRRDFTATMLSSGNVFIAGGRRNTDVGSYVQANVSFDAEDGTFGTESALVIGRRGHAAITMNDGRVAIIGGFNEEYAPAYDVNTDDNWYNWGEEGYLVGPRHNPGYHGFIDTVELFDKFGKPTIISGSEAGIKTLPYRVANASGILSPGGRLYLYGGRGNIPVTFADISVEFAKDRKDNQYCNDKNDSCIVTMGTPSESGDARIMNIDQENSHLYFDLAKTTLSRPVSGRIIDGDIFVPTSDENKVAVETGSRDNGGIAVSFVGHPKQNHLSWDKDDIRAPLDGVEVGRQYDPKYKSGQISENGLEFKDIDGKITFYPVIASGIDADSSSFQARYNSLFPTLYNAYHKCSSGTHLPYLNLFAENPGNTEAVCLAGIEEGDEVYARISDARISLTIENLPVVYSGANLSGKLTIEGFTIERADNNDNENYPPIVVSGLTSGSVATYNFNRSAECQEGSGDDAGSCTLKLDGIRFSVNNNNPLIGTIENTGEGTIGSSTISATMQNAKVSSLSIKITLTADKVTLTGETYNVATSTIVIRDMLFSNNLSYDPVEAKWEYGVSEKATDTLYEYTAAKELDHPTALIDHNMVITASGAPMILGGRSCADDYCHRTNQDYTYVENKPLYERENSLFAMSDAEMLPVKRVYPYGRGAGGTLNFPRQGHTATVLPNKKILVCGGTNGVQTLDSCELYNPETREWDITGSMRTPRSGHTATLLSNGKVILTGGTDGTKLLNSSEVYNPKYEKFDDTVTYMNKTRQNHTATILPNGNVFVAGGATTEGYEIFITTEAQWKMIYPTAKVLSHHTATLLKNGKVAIIGGLGITGSPVNEYYICDPAHVDNSLPGDSCHTIDSQRKIYMHASVLDKNGSVWVIGGSNGNYPSNEVYKYIPNGNDFTMRYVGTLKEGITGHTANIGPDNVITVYGGKTASSAVGYVTYIKTDLESMSISAGEPLYKRANHTTVLDSDGYYMIIGGDDGLGTNYTSVDRNYFTELPDNYVKADYTPTRRPEITNGESENAQPGSLFTLLSTNTVHNFHGYTEAGDGKAVYHNTPRVVMQAMDNFSGFLVDISTNFYVSAINSRDWNTMMSSMTAQLPGTLGLTTGNPELPWGYYYAIESVNGQYSNFKRVQIGENWELPMVSTPIAPLDNDYCDPGTGSVPAPCSNPDYAISSITGYSVYESSVVWRWAPLPDLAGVNKHVSGYEVYSATSTETGPSLGRVPIDRNGHINDIPVFVSSGLPPNFPARIKVAAFNIWAESDKFATSDTYYTLASSATLNISVSGFETVELNWTSRNYSGTCYQVDWCKSNDVSKDCFLPEFSGNKILEGTFSDTSFAGGSCYSSSSYTATGLTPATGYWFRVKARNGMNSSDWPEHRHASGFDTEYSNHVSTITVDTMSDIIGTPTSSTITWTWDRIGSENDTVIYEIAEIINGVVHQSFDYVPENVTASTKKIEYIMTTTDTEGDSSLKANTGYQIRVTPRMDVEINGVIETYYGNYKDSPIVYTLAKNPNGLELANNLGDNQPLTEALKISWQDNGNSSTTIYNIEISTVSDFSSIAYTSSTTYANGNNQAVAGFLPNTYYYGRISAINDAGNATEYVYFTDEEGKKAKVCTYANLPSDMKVTANSMSGISVGWEHNGNPQVFDARGVQTGTRYEISISTQSTFPSSPLPPYPTKTESTVETNHHFSGLLTHTWYYVQIQSYNQDNELTKASAITTISTVTAVGPGNIDGSVGGASNPSRDVTISGNFMSQRYVSLLIPAAAYDKETAVAIAPYEYKDNRGAGAIIHEKADYCKQHSVDPTFPIITAKIFTDNPNPKVPVDFTIGYFDPEESGPLESYRDEIVLARFNSKTNSCLPLKTLFNQSSKVITASINTFDSETALEEDGATVIQVIKRAAPTNMDEVKVYPNPMYVSRGDGYVTIEPVPAHTKLTLYTLSGAKIWEGSSDNSFVIVWKGENKYGNPVASGVYLGVLDSPAGKKKIKIAVEK